MKKQKLTRQQRFKSGPNTKIPWRIALSLICIVILLLGTLAGKYFADLNHAFTRVNQEADQPAGTTKVEVQKIRPKEASLEEGEPINFLLLGTDDDGRGRDESKGYVSRSDSMMILSLNPKTRTTKLLSIPRDVYTFIQGQDGPDKINHAYAFGGVNLTIDTVQNFLNVPIDYYAVINMQGLEQLVDAVGGIDITSPLTFTYQESSFVEGQTRHVDGWNAMNFARMRYDDPEGETGRQNRQKLVIKALVDKLTSVESVTNFPKLMEVVGKNIKTNIDLKEALTIYKKYTPALQTITSIKFEGLEDLYLNEVYYFYAPMSSRLKVANELRRNSGLTPITAANLRDPLGDDSGSATAQSMVSRTSKLIINQYPTGFSDSELQQVSQTQTSAQTIRQAEYYNPWTPADDYSVPSYQPDYNEPTPTEPAVPDTPAPAVPEPQPSTPEPANPQPDPNPAPDASSAD